MQFNFESVANDAARQSTKADLGATRAARFNVMAALEFASAGLTAGEYVEFYWASSPSSTAANANPAGVSGSDAAYAGYASNLNASLK